MDQYKGLIISRSVLIRMRSVSDKSCRESKNTFYVEKLFFKENRAVCAITWKNIVERGRPPMTVSALLAG